MLRRPTIAILLRLSLALLLGGWLLEIILNPKLARLVDNVVFSPNGLALATQTDDSCVITWDVTTGQRLATIPFNEEAWEVFAFPASTPRLLATGPRDGRIVLWDVVTGREKESYPIADSERGRGFQFSSDGRILAAISEEWILLWPWRENPTPWEISFKSKDVITDLAFSPDGKTLAISSLDRTVRLVDIASGKQTEELYWDEGEDSWDNTPRRLAFSVSGDELYVGLDDGHLLVWKVATATLKGALFHDDLGVTSLSVSPDGKYFASSGWDSQATLWDVETLFPVRNLYADAGIRSVAFAPNSRYLAAGLDDGTAIIWDAESGTIVRHFVMERSTTRYWLWGLAIWVTCYVVYWRRSFQLAWASVRDFVRKVRRVQVDSPTRWKRLCSLRREIYYSFIPRAVSRIDVGLAVSLLIYGLLCLPALTHHDERPLHTAWIEVTYLWFVPLVVAALVDSRSLWTRWKGITAYCVAAAFIQSCLPEWLYYQHHPLSQSLREMLLYYGPIFLLIGLVIDSVVRLFRWLARRMFPSLSAETTQWMRNLAAIFFVLLMAGLLLWSKLDVDAINRELARQQADEDWNSGNARLYGVNPFDDFPVEHFYDPATGLEFEHGRSLPLAWTEAYNQRMQENIRRRRTPAWSMKPHLVDDRDLMKMLYSDDMERVSTFPNDVSDSITLMRRGTIERWGHEYTNENNGLKVVLKNGDLYELGRRDEEAYVAQLSKYPHVYFVRSGKRWIAAIHESGRLLSFLQLRTN